MSHTISIRPGKNQLIGRAGGVQALPASGLGLTSNSIQPRPFYIIGHNTNSIEEVSKALDQGANAIEPDINVSLSGHLCVSHDQPLVDLPQITPPLEAFLRDLHDLALRRPELALILFDCKPPTHTADGAVALLTAIRQLLTYDTHLNIILSVSSLKGAAAMFPAIQGDLREREGLMIDEENSPVEVSGFFDRAGVVNRGFGNGIAVPNATDPRPDLLDTQSQLLGPGIFPSMEEACFYRASDNKMKFIYVWSVNDLVYRTEYLRIGVDGMITDDVASLRKIIDMREFRRLVRYAQRSDDPYNRPNAAYGLAIHTGNDGTDAIVRITLTGASGSAAVIINSRLPHRLEQDTWTYVTIQSDDLGPLQSITVQRDSSGFSPGWFLDRIKVRSFAYGVAEVEAVFNRLIDTTEPFTQAF